MTDDMQRERGPEREHDTDGGAPAGQGTAGDRSRSAASEEVEAARSVNGGPSSDHRETRAPLQPGNGPRERQGDALLDGTGTRHGVDARDERPGNG